MMVKTLIDSLRSEINILRSEIKSKDKIIEMIINDGSTQNRTNINNGTEQKVLKPTQESNILDSFTYNITDNINTNRFNVSQEALDNDVRDTQGNTRDGFKEEKRKSNTRRSLTIIGDSLVKEMKPYKMQQ